MQAVNLIPADERHNAAGVGGRSNGAAYLLLVVLALAVAVLGAHAVLSSRASEAQTETASLNARAQAVEAQASSRKASAPTASYATLRAKRVDAVTQLVRSRIGWPSKLRQLAQALPRDVDLQQLSASASSAGAGASASSLRGALDVPAFELSGCAASQDEVASTLTDLQSLDGVTRVSLASSEAADDGAGTTATSSSPVGGGAAGGCGDRLAFSAVIFFTPPTTAGPAGSTDTTAP